MQEGEIYQIQYLSLLPNTQRYNLTTQQYIILIIRSTSIEIMEEKIPMMPHNTFLTLRYRLLINIATASNYLPGKQLHILKHVFTKYNFPASKNIMPDVVGQVKLIQGTDLQNPRVASKVVVGLLLNSYRASTSFYTNHVNSTPLFPILVQRHFIYTCMFHAVPE